MKKISSFIFTNINFFLLRIALFKRPNNEHLFHVVNKLRLFKGQSKKETMFRNQSQPSLPVLDPLSLKT
jgi:hypothetical protein